MSTTPEAMLDEENLPICDHRPWQERVPLGFLDGFSHSAREFGLEQEGLSGDSPKEFHALTKCYWERIEHLSPRISRPAGRCSLTKGGVLQLSPGGTKPFDFAQVQVWSDR